MFTASRHDIENLLQVVQLIFYEIFRRDGGARPMANDSSSFCCNVESPSAQNIAQLHDD